MAQLSRTAYQAPTIDAETANIFSNLETLTNLYRNEEGWRANTFKDVDEKSFIPSILFWADKDLYQTIRRSLADPYVALFTEWDPKAPLRGGNFKRTETGWAYPDVITREDEKKPGEALTSHKQYYLSIYQDENAKIEPIHLRSCVDTHLLDFAQHFHDFDDYNRITLQTFSAIHEGLQLVDKLLVDTFIISLFGGYLHCYPIGSPLYRFFAGTGVGDLTPDETFSKEAKEFFKPDGKLSKKIQEIAKWTKKFYTSKFFYLTNVLEGEILPGNLPKTIPEMSAMPVKTTSKAECLKAIRGWFMEQNSESKFTNIGYHQRRMSLYHFVSVIAGTIRELCTFDARNWCGFDFYTENKDKLGFPLQARRNDLVVFMNDEDLEDLRFGLKGSPVMGQITEAMNGQIERLEKSGVTFFGLNYILPGHAAIFDKNLCFKMKEFYNSDNKEYFAYHLVESRIKHVIKQPIIYSKTVFRALLPGEGQKFAVSPYWAAKNMPALVEK